MQQLPLKSFCLSTTNGYEMLMGKGKGKEGQKEREEERRRRSEGVTASEAARAAIGVQTIWHIVAELGQKKHLAYARLMAIIC